MEAVIPRVRELLEPLVAAAGLELFDVELRAGVLHVYVDRPGGVDLDSISQAGTAVSAGVDEGDPIPGRHTLQNAMAAVAVASQVGVPFDEIAGSLRVFEAPERRFERYGEAAGVLVVDDYAHHPTEIAAVLAAARTALARRLIVAFQPHRYTRTQQLMDEFGPALKQADEIVLADVYPAGEDPIAGVTVEALAASIHRTAPELPVRIARRLDDVVPEVLKAARAGDAVITLGAGSIGTLPKRLIEALKRRETSN